MGSHTDIDTDTYTQQQQQQQPAPVPSTSRAAAAGQSRAEKQSAASHFLHTNRGYPRSVKEILRRHPKLQEYEPAEASRDVFKFVQGKRAGSLIQTHVRFRFDYAHVLKHLLSVFGRLFALQGDSRDAFKVVITFNAILFCQDSGTYSVFLWHGSQRK